MDVQGYCPLGCGQTLFVGDGGYVTCSYSECPRPDAASDILLDPETEHVVTLASEGFTVKHPLRERLDDALLDCMLHETIQHGGPPAAPGIYRVTHVGHDPVNSSLGGDWHWERWERQS